IGDSLPAYIIRALRRIRLPGRPDGPPPSTTLTDPSRTASTFSVRAISATVLVAPLNRITDVREITVISGTVPIIPISSSGKPSAKYSCDESADAFTNGRMASVWMPRGAALPGIMLRTVGQPRAPTSSAAAAAPAIAAACDHRRDRSSVGSWGGDGATAEVSD